MELADIIFHIDPLLGNLLVFWFHIEYFDLEETGLKLCLLSLVIRPLFLQLSDEEKYKRKEKYFLRETRLSH